MLASKHFWKVVLLWMLFLASVATFVYLPWFDEVFMSNISSSFLRDGKLNLTLALNGNESEILTYGPLTFWVQSTFFSVFGESFLVGRMVNVLFGFGLFILIYNWLKKEQTISTARLLLLFLLTDMAILTSLLCGRLDFISIFLFSIGLFLFVKKRTSVAIILSGLLFAAAYLSTPRIGIYLVGFVPFFVIESISQKNFKKNIIDYGLMFTAFIIPVALWIFIKFGNLDAYFTQYTENPLIVEHVGGTSFLPKMYQIIPLALIVLLILYKWKNKINIPQYIWLLIFIIFLHLAFIKEVGPYSGMIMPFVYIVLAVLIDRSLLQKFKVMQYGIALYLLAMIGIFMLKAAIMTATFSQRSPAGYANKISEKIDLSNQTKVLADYKFYYILKDSNVDFKSLDYNIKDINLDQLHSFDYIIVDGIGLKKLKKQFPSETFTETKIDNSTKVNIPSFLKAFDNDYNGFIVTFPDKK